MVFPHHFIFRRWRSTWRTPYRRELLRRIRTITLLWLAKPSLLSLSTSPNSSKRYRFISSDTHTRLDFVVYTGGSFFFLFNNINIIYFTVILCLSTRGCCSSCSGPRCSPAWLRTRRRSWWKSCRALSESLVCLRLEFKSVWGLDVHLLRIVWLGRVIASGQCRTFTHHSYSSYTVGMCGDGANDCGVSIDHFFGLFACELIDDSFVNQHKCVLLLKLWWKVISLCLRLWRELIAGSLCPSWRPLWLHRSPPPPQTSPVSPTWSGRNSLLRGDHTDYSVLLYTDTTGHEHLVWWCRYSYTLTIYWIDSGIYWTKLTLITLTYLLLFLTFFHSLN